MRRLYEVHTFQRSGSHAIYNWLFSQFSEPVLYFNNAKEYQDPAIEMRNPDWDLNNVVNLQPYWQDPSKREEIQQMVNENVVIGFEDRVLGFLIPTASLKWINPDEIWQLMILRDVYNWAASRWEKGLEISPQKIFMWRIYAERRHNYEFISYNDWFKSAEYRSKVLDNLDIKQINDDVNFVPKSGGGSSFDKRRFRDNGSQMDVLNRWKELHDNAIKRFIWRDKELIRLNIELFGMEYPW